MSAWLSDSWRMIMRQERSSPLFLWHLHVVEATILVVFAKSLFEKSEGCTSRSKSFQTESMEKSVRT